MTHRTLKRWLQDYLGMTDIMQDIDNLAQIVERREQQIRPLLNGIGRIIAKHDGLYAQSENPLDNLERKAASDDLGKAVIQRLKDEDNARRHTLGEL